MPLVQFDNIQASQSVQTLQSFFGVGNTAGNTTITGGDIYLSGGPNITISMTGSTIGFSAGSAAASPVNFSAGTTSNNLATVVFSNSNGVSFGLNGSTITASVSPGGGGLTNINVSAGTTSNNLSNIVFSNSNGITFGLNGSTVTGSHNGLITQSNQNISFFALGNTTQNSSTVLGANAVSFNGLGELSVGFSNGSINLSANVDAISAYAVSNTTQSSSGTLNVGSLSFAGAGVASVGISNGSVVVSVPSGGGGLTNINVSAGLNSNNLSNLEFDNANGVSFGLNGSTITASIAANATISTFVPYFPASTGSQTIGALGTSTASAMVFPVIIPQDLKFNVIKILQSGSFVSSTISGQQTISSNFALYSNNNGTLSQISSNSLSYALTVSSVSATLSYPASTGTNGYTYTTLGVTTTAQAQSLFGTAGNRVVEMVFSNSVSLSPGIYWLGIHQRQSTSSAAVGMSTGFVGNSMNGSSANGPIGQSTNQFSSRSDFHLGAHGFYTSTGSAGYSGTNLPSSMLLNGFNNNLNVMPMVTFMST